MGKEIRQRFINEDADDCWWETGKVMSFDHNDLSTNFTVNFFDDNEFLDFDEIPVCFYEVLKLPLLTDYLNHDVQFL